MPHSNFSFNDSTETCIFQIDTDITGFRCVWTIEDYMQVKKYSEFQKCVQVKKWLNLSFEKGSYSRMWLYPNGYDKEGEPEVYIELSKRATGFKEQPVLKLSFLDISKQPIFSIEGSRGEIKNNAYGWTWVIINQVTELCNPEKFLVNGSLVILLEGAASTKINADGTGTEVCNLLLYKQLSHLDSALKQMSFQNKYSDVIFSVGDEQFELHKVILANKSEVFDKMFSSDQKEVQNIIPLEDLTSNVFRELVHFIYTNSVTQNFHDMALELFKAADVYKVQELKNLCERNLLNNIVVANAVNCFVTAYNFSANELKKKSAEIIRENWDEIQNTDGWIELENNPQLLIHLMNINFSKK